MKTFTHDEDEGLETFDNYKLGLETFIDYEQSAFIKKSSVQYVAEKPVAESKMVEIVFDMKSKDVNPDNIKGLRKAHVINRSYFPQCATRSYEYAIGVSSSFSFRHDQKHFKKSFAANHICDCSWSEKFIWNSIIEILAVTLISAKLRQRFGVKSTEETKADIIFVYNSKTLWKINLSMV